MNDVEVFGRDGSAVKHGCSTTYHDELDSGVHESPEELSDVSVRWTWHLSMRGVKRRSSQQRGAGPMAKAKGPTV